MSFSVGLPIKTLVTESQGMVVAPFLFRDNEIHYLSASSTTLYYRKYNVITGALTTVNTWNIQNVLIPSGSSLSFISAVYSPDGNVILGVLYNVPSNSTSQGCVALINLSTLSLTPGAYCNKTSQSGNACSRYLFFDYENNFIHFSYSVYTQGATYCADGIWNYPSLSFYGVNYLSYSSGGPCGNCECPHAAVGGKCCGVLFAWASDCHYLAVINPKSPTSASFPWGNGWYAEGFYVVANEKYMVYRNTSGQLVIITPSTYPNTAFTLNYNVTPSALLGDILLTSGNVINLATKQVLSNVGFNVGSQYVMGNNIIFYDNGNQLNALYLNPFINVSFSYDGNTAVVKVYSYDGIPIPNKNVNIFQITGVSSINIFSNRLVASGTTNSQGIFTATISSLPYNFPLYALVD